MITVIFEILVGMYDDPFLIGRSKECYFSVINVVIFDERQSNDRIDILFGQIYFIFDFLIERNGCEKRRYASGHHGVVFEIVIINVDGKFAIFKQATNGHNAILQFTVTIDQIDQIEYVQEQVNGVVARRVALVDGIQHLVQRDQNEIVLFFYRCQFRVRRRDGSRFGRLLRRRRGRHHRR